MAKTLRQWRVALAQALDMYHTGTASATGTTLQIIDTVGLKRFTEDDVLIGGLAYIVTDAGGAHAAPEGEHKFISDYAAAASNIVTLFSAFTAAPATGDTYEIYRGSYVSLADWNEVVNRGILSAWPEVYGRDYTTLTLYGGMTEYTLPGASMEVELAELLPIGALAGYPLQPLARSLDYAVVGEPGRNLTLHLLRPPDPDRHQLRVHYRSQYAALAAEGSQTYLDDQYILDAARAEWYQMMVDKARGQARSQAALQLVNFYRSQALRQKQQLMAALEMAKGGLVGGKRN